MWCLADKVARVEWGMPDARRRLRLASELVLAAGLVAALAGCTPGATDPSARTQPVAAAPVAPAASVVAAPPATATATPDAAAVAAARQVPPDVRSAEGAVAFVVELCRRAAAGDQAWVAAHLALPLLGNGVVNDESSDVLLGRIADQVGDVAPGALCRAAPAAAKDAQPFVGTERGTEGVIRIGAHAYRLRFELPERGEARLVEASFVLPELGAKPKKPRRKFVLGGRVQSASDRSGEVSAAIIEPTIQKDPACIFEHASRYKESATVFVVAAKRDGVPAAAARVYASSAVPASLIACLERQLDRAYASTFRGTPFELRYVLMIGIPLAEGEVDPNANTILMRGP